MHRSLPFCLGPPLPNWYGSNKAVPDRGFSLWTMHTRAREDVKTLEARPQGKCLLSQEATAEQAHTVRMAPCLCTTPTHPSISSHCLPSGCIYLEASPSPAWFLLSSPCVCQYWLGTQSHTFSPTSPHPLRLSSYLKKNKIKNGEP